MLDQIQKQVAAFNFVVFESTAQLGKSEFLALNRQFGLQVLDINLPPNIVQQAAKDICQMADIQIK